MTQITFEEAYDSAHGFADRVIEFWDRHPRKIARFRKQVVDAAAGHWPGSDFSVKIDIRRLLPFHLRALLYVEFLKRKGEAHEGFADAIRLPMLVYLQERTLPIEKFYVNSLFRVEIVYKVPSMASRP